MAERNFFSVVNLTGSKLDVHIGGVQVAIPAATDLSKQISAGHELSQKGESFDLEISKVGGSSIQVSMNVNPGANSWSTFAFTSNGYVNVFPANPGAFNKQI